MLSKKNNNNIMTASISTSNIDFTMKSHLGYPSAYTIHFGNSDRLLTQLSSEDSLVSKFFQTALNGKLKGDRLASNFQTFEKATETKYAELERKCKEQGVDFAQFAWLREQEELLFLNPTPRFNAELEANNGNDVVTVKRMVNHILGIERQVPYIIGENGELEATPDIYACHADKDNIKTIALEDRQRYFQIMKESGFLESSAESLETFCYTPSTVIKTLLENNPEVDTLLMGCGKAVLESTYNCAKVESLNAHHLNTALSIDISTLIDPHLVADFKDPKIYEQIPDGRIKNIIDHSNGVLNGIPTEMNRQVFEQLHRILQPGGSIVFVHLCNEEIEFLQEIGFVIEEDKIAKKKETQ